MFQSYTQDSMSHVRPVCWAGVGMKDSDLFCPGVGNHLMGLGLCFNQH